MKPKPADRLRYLVHPFLEALGAEYHGDRWEGSPRGYGYEWSFKTTRYNLPLHVTVYDNWIACRFENEAKSLTDYKYNPGGYTGKWNFHISHKSKYPSLEQAKALAEDFLIQLNGSLPGERPILPEIEGFIKRQNLIEKGKLWQVYPADDINVVEKEGCETECMSYIKEKYGLAAYKNGQIRIGKVIWENL